MAASRQKKVNWEDLEKTPRDKVSIEHVFRQTLSEKWLNAFEGIGDDELNKCTNTLGNLILLLIHWRPKEILGRGLRLIDFVEQRWSFKCDSIDAKQALLFMDFLEEVEEP